MRKDRRRPHETDRQRAKVGRATSSSSPSRRQPSAAVRKWAGLRDPWLGVALLALLPLVAHAWGPTLGEPVAEDFDFLHRALFGPHTLLDGGGSMAFWRPISHQIYYAVLAPLILDHPRVLALIHILLVGVSTVFIYRTLRIHWSGPWAAAAASFPLLAESTRTLISWPSHFVDLGVWLFTALALHEAASRRLPTTLLALLAALLCKEVAVVAAVLIPWMPGLGPRRVRWRWMAATGGLVALWSAAYIGVRRHAGLALPYDLEASITHHWRESPGWIVWAVGNSLRAMASLPRSHVPWEGTIAVAAGGLLLVTGFAWVGHKARARLLESGPWISWGLLWFLLASATLATVHPLWSPNRSAYGSMGFGIFCTALLGSARPALLVALVGLRLIGFAWSPAPPTRIAEEPPSTGAFMDFEQLTRLQRLMSEIRRTLKQHDPVLPHRSVVTELYMPHQAVYAFGKSQAFQVWYRDSTLRWLRFQEFKAHPEIPLAMILEFEPNQPRQISLVDPEAARHALRGESLMEAGAWERALEEFDRAERLQRDRGAEGFYGSIVSWRALARHNLKRDEASSRGPGPGTARKPGP